MSFREAIVSVFKNYANFKGRARRREYWYFYLLSIIVTAVGLAIEGILYNDEYVSFSGIYIIWIYGAATIIPSFSVTCRRLHDVGKSGAYMFFFLLPILGEILMWVWAFEDGQPWTNQYGPDPKGREMGFGGYPPHPIAPTKRCSDSGSEIDGPESTTKATANCANCGKTISAGTAFCPFCGENQNKAKHERGSTSGESRLKGKGLLPPTDLD